MVVLETKHLKNLRRQITHSKELDTNERKNFMNFIWYLTKEERDTLSLLV